MHSRVSRRLLHEQRERSIAGNRALTAIGIQRAVWPEQDSNWLITFSDLTLHLLCFLLILYLSVRQKEEKNHAPLTYGQAAAASVESVARAVVTEPETAAVAGRWKALQAEMEQYVDGLGLSSGVGVASTHSGLNISLRDTFPFASGKADLLPAGLRILKKVAALAARHSDLHLEVTGHTDNIPIATSEFPSNWELSTARSSRVARYLIECGVGASRLTVQGYGSFHPLRPNNSPGNRAVNRRVEIRLYRGVDKEESAQ